MSTRNRAKRAKPQWSEDYRRKSESDVGRIVKPEPIRRAADYVQSPPKGPR